MYCHFYSHRKYQHIYKYTYTVMAIAARVHEQAKETSTVPLVANEAKNKQ